MLMYPMNPIDADQANQGIMAIHISQGARPLVTYGLPYYGPLDAYLTAPLIAIFGADRMVIRVVSVGFCLAFVWITFLLGKRFFSEAVGWYSAIYAAISPFMLTFRGLMADADYIMVLVVGSLSLLQFHSWLQNPGWMKLFRLIFLLALGFWLHPVMGYYLLTMGVVLLSRQLGTGRRIRINRPVATIPVVLHPFLFLGGFGYYLQFLVTLTLPIMLGFLVPSPYTPLDMAAQLMLRGSIWGILAVVFSCSIVILIAWVGIRAIKEGNSILPVFAFTTLMIFTVFSASIHIKEDALTLPRYFTPLYSAIPLGVFTLFSVTRRCTRLRPILFGALLAINLYGNISMRAVPAPYPLLEWLKGRGGMQYVYTDYWTGYWLAFESNEKVIPSIFDDNNQSGFNRYQSYAREVEESVNPLYIYILGKQNQKDFQTHLDATQIQYQRLILDGYVIYYQLSSHVSYPIMD
jgi:hypothetical protein